MKFKFTNWVFACLATVSGSTFAQEAEVTIAHVGPTSGGYSFLGRDTENGATLAIDELNAAGVSIGGSKVTLKLMKMDDRADPQSGISAARKIVGAKVSGVIGHVHSGISIPASKEYSNAGIPQITAASTSPAFTRQGLKTTFRVIADDVGVGGALGRYAINTLNGKMIVVVDDNTSYGRGLSDEFVTAVTAAGGSIASRHRSSDTAKTFDAIVADAKQKKADVVFFAGADSVAGPLLRQLRGAEVNAKFLGGDAVCTKELARVTADVAKDNEIVCGEPGGFTEQERLSIDDFRKKYRQRFGGDMQQFAPFAYDAVKVMVTAMIKAGSADPATYLPALAASDFQGITGPIKFDEKGDVIKGAITLRALRGGKFEVLTVFR